MKLSEKRTLFTSCVAKLLVYMIECGERPALGRDGEKHMKDSLHYDGLAVDIILYDENFLPKEDTEAHRKYGEYWESLHELCFWGGAGKKVDGLKNDGNHYSITDRGRK